MSHTLDHLATGVPHDPSQYRPEPFSRRFRSSKALGAILGVGLALGLVAIFTAGSSGSSVSDRVSNAVGHSASCAKIGAAEVAGDQSSLYRCEITTSGSTGVGCFAVSDGAVKQYFGGRKLGC
jgi:hypothetical protein